MYNDQHGKSGLFNLMFITGPTVCRAHPREPQESLGAAGEEGHLFLRSSKTKLDKTTSFFFFFWQNHFWPQLSHPCLVLLTAFFREPHLRHTRSFPLGSQPTCVHSVPVKVKDAAGALSPLVSNLISTGYSNGRANRDLKFNKTQS